jgi:ribonuclease Z
VAFGKDLKRITVHARAEKLAAITGHLLAEALFPVPLPCDWQPLTATVPVGRQGRLSYFAVEHPGGAIGFRLDWPQRSMAYVTDTTAAPRAAYVDAIQGVDLLVHECNFPDGWESFAERTGHSCTTAVSQVARDAGVRRLILAHVNPLLDDQDPVGLEQARSIFPATELATDELEIEF